MCLVIFLPRRRGAPEGGSSRDEGHAEAHGHPRYDIQRAMAQMLLLHNAALASLLEMRAALFSLQLAVFGLETVGWWNDIPTFLLSSSTAMTIKSDLMLPGYLDYRMLDFALRFACVCRFCQGPRASAYREGQHAGWDVRTAGRRVKAPGWLPSALASS